MKQNKRITEENEAKLKEIVKEFTKDYIDLNLTITCEIPDMRINKVSSVRPKVYFTTRSNHVTQWYIHRRKSRSDTPPYFLRRRRVWFEKLSPSLQ